jgi:flagellar biosynthetic protein FliR
MSINIGDELALAFGLLFARCGGMLMALPAMLGISLPVRIRLMLSTLLAASLMPIAKVALPGAGGAFHVVLMLARELALGATIAFTAAIVVGAVLTTGDVLGNSMELHSGGILRGPIQFPNVLGDALGTLAGLLFFIAGFHRALILGLGRSLGVAPLGVATIPGIDSMIAGGGKVFVLALELALPLLIPLLILSLAQGILARLAPQLNMLMAAPAAIVIAGFVLLIMDSHGIAIGITRAWGAMIDQALGWTNG